MYSSQHFPGYIPKMRSVQLQFTSSIHKSMGTDLPYNFCRCCPMQTNLLNGLDSLGSRHLAPSPMRARVPCFGLALASYYVGSSPHGPRYNAVLPWPCACSAFAGDPQLPADFLTTGRILRQRGGATRVQAKLRKHRMAAQKQSTSWLSHIDRTTALSGSSIRGRRYLVARGLSRGDNKTQRHQIGLWRQ